MKNLIRKILKEEMDSEWDWMEDISEIDYLRNKCFVFDPPYSIENHTDSNDPYITLFDFFVSLGLKPKYNTPRITDNDVIGLYVEDDGKHFVYTQNLSDGEDYELHIIQYSKDEGYDITPQILDAIEFIEEMNLWLDTDLY